MADLPQSGTQYFASIVVQAVLAIGLVALVPLVVRRLGYAYAIYTFMVVGIPLLESKDFYGLGRYCLAAFPRSRSSATCSRHARGCAWHG